MIKKILKYLLGFTGIYAGIPLLGKLLFGNCEKEISTLDDIVEDSSNPLRAFKTEVNNQNVYVIGVLHSWLAEKTGRYGDYIEKVKKVLVKEADYVALEGPDFIYNQRGIVDDVLRNGSILLGGVVYPLNAMGFFWDIESDLKKYRKELVVIDPITLQGALGGNLPNILAAGYVGYVGKKLLLEKDKMSRRDLLKLAGVGSFALFSNLLDIAGIVDLPNYFDTLFTGEYHGLPRTLTQYDEIDRWTYFNYICDVRNVFIAEGVDVFTKYLKEEEGKVDDNVVLIHGAAHNAVAGYLEYKDVRKEKLKLYTAYNPIADRSVRIYEYDERHDEWRLRKKLPY
jgi:hypothetical protein